jgi:subtilisin family serine protease
MKKYARLLIVVAILISGMVVAQSPVKYWIQFTDKGNNSYSLSNPAAYLSADAIQRRTNFNIALDSADLPVTPIYINAVAQTGVTVRAVSKWLNGVVIITSDTAALSQINQLPFVQNVNSVGLRTSTATSDKFEEETFEELQPETERNATVHTTMLNYGQSYNQAEMIGAVCLHNSGYKGQGMVISVIDAGFWGVDTMRIFDSLWANNRILGTRDFVTGDTMVFEDNTHGMMVLSCMGGYLDGQLVGTAPEASYWLLRSEEAATEYIVEEYFWAAAAEFADSVGADLINSSLGYTTFDDPAQNHTYQDMNGNIAPCSRAADFAASRGLLVCNSAGNSGSNSWFYIGAPADADSILAIGAVDASEQYASFSSRGPSSDGQVKPECAAQGQATIVANPTNGGVMGGNGTSFASPVLCGAVACLWQAHPNLTNMDIREAVLLSSHLFFNPDTYMGFGIPDLCAANLTLDASPVANTEDDVLYDVQPNPFTADFSFSYYSLYNKDVTVRLTDITGRFVLEQTMQAAGSSVNRFVINTNGIAEGVYTLSVISFDQVLSEKIIKQ